MPTPLTAVPASTTTLSESAISGVGGTYPGSDTNPGADTDPGRGSDVTATAITTTQDYIPATVPFLVQTGERILYATPI